MHLVAHVLDLQRISCYYNLFADHNLIKREDTTIIVAGIQPRLVRSLGFRYYPCNTKANYLTPTAIVYPYTDFQSLDTRLITPVAFSDNPFQSQSLYPDNTLLMQYIDIRFTK